MPVAVSPAVDGLLDVSDDEQRVPYSRQHIGHQLLDDAPLEHARVLELIDENMLVSDACFLEDKIRVTSLERTAEGACRLCEQRTVRLRQTALNQGLQRSHQLHVSTETDGQLNGVVQSSGSGCEFCGTCHRFGIAVLLTHASESVSGRYFLRISHTAGQSVVRTFGISVIVRRITLREQGFQLCDGLVRGP